MKHSGKRSPLHIGTNATKALVLRVPPELHEALISKAGSEQQRQNRRVSMNTLATSYLAEALGFEIKQNE